MATSAKEVISQRGKEKFQHYGFLNIFEKSSKRNQDLLFRQCDQVGRCNARLYIIHGAVIKKVNVHSHNPCAASVDAAKTITKIKMRAATTMENPSVIINEVLGNTAQGTQGAMPRPCAIKKIIRRKRKEISAAPPNPLNLRELTLSSEFQVYKPENGGNEEFLLSDSGPLLSLGEQSLLEDLWKQTQNSVSILGNKITFFQEQ